MKKITTALACSLSLLCAAWTADASAAQDPYLTVTALEYVSPLTGTIKTSATSNENAYIGAFSTIGTNYPVAFETWCIDIHQTTSLNDRVFDYTVSSEPTALGTDPVQQNHARLLQGLATEALSRVHDASTSAAFQLAVWEIMNEPSASFDLTSGNFLVTNVSNDALTLATTWLNGLPAAGTPSAYDLTVFASPTKQDLVRFTKVPEPATVAVFGISLLGLLGARRKSKK